MILVKPLPCQDLTSYPYLLVKALGVVAAYGLISFMIYLLHPEI